MSRWDDFLDEKPPAELDAKVFASVEAELQKTSRRSWLMAWWWAPVALGVGGLLAVRLKQKPSAPEDTLTAEIEDETGLAGEESYTLLEEMDLFEDLEVLEKWTTS